MSASDVPVALVRGLTLGRVPARKVEAYLPPEEVAERVGELLRQGYDFLIIVVFPPGYNSENRKEENT